MTAIISQEGSMKILFLMIFASVALAEDNHSVNHATTHTTPLPTIEAAAATDGSFGNGAVLAPVWKGLIAEGVWYNSQGRNVSFAGAGYTIRPHRSVILIPSLYGVRGSGEHDTVAIGFRAIVENKRMIADLGIIRTFGGANGEDHDMFVDPSHFSARIGKLQTGYAVEFFRHIGNQSHVAETNTVHSLAVTAPPAPTHLTSHKTDEWLHGPRIGWELSSRMHVFYAALYKSDGHWEHKVGTTFFFSDLLRKKK